MAKRQRRPAEPGEFSDPLQNYDPPDYADAFENFLAEAEVREMELTPYLQIEPTQTVGEMVQKMAENDLFCAVIVENGKLVGIFSERDMLNRVGENFEQLRDKPIRELMTPNPASVYATETPAKVLNLMAVGGFRHLPVLDVDDRLIGLIGPRRVVRLLETHAN